MIKIYWVWGKWEFETKKQTLRVITEQDETQINVAQLSTKEIKYEQTIRNESSNYFFPVFND